MTAPWVVDTNVGGIANERINEDTRSPECVLACVTFLTALMRSGSIALDSGWKIVAEYRHILSSTGEPGIGDAFLKWTLTNQENSGRCHKVDIDEIAVPAELAGFDPADMKFIKTAVACMGAHVAEAADSLWWKRRADFVAAGIVVDFLCPDYIKILSDGKYGSDD